jgi:hypothetical protein
MDNIGRFVTYAVSVAISITSEGQESGAIAPAPIKI